MWPRTLLNVIFGDESYREEIELTAEQFYEEVKVKELPKTSQPALGDFVLLFEKLRHKYRRFDGVNLGKEITRKSG